MNYHWFPLSLASLLLVTAAQAVPVTLPDGTSVDIPTTACWALAWNDPTGPTQGAVSKCPPPPATTPPVPTPAQQPLVAPPLQAPTGGVDPFFAGGGMNVTIPAGTTHAWLYAYPLGTPGALVAAPSDVLTVAQPFLKSTIAPSFVGTLCFRFQGTNESGAVVWSSSEQCL